jgi:hypothetical protein
VCSTYAGRGLPGGRAVQSAAAGRPRHLSLLPPNILLNLCCCNVCVTGMGAVIGFLYVHTGGFPPPFLHVIQRNGEGGVQPRVLQTARSHRTNSIQISVAPSLRHHACNGRSKRCGGASLLAAWLGGPPLALQQHEESGCTRA